MKKTEGDTITLNEFSSFLQKRHLDGNFSMNEQRLLFEKFDKGFTNRIKVCDVLNYCGAEAVSADDTTRGAFEVKTHVIDLLEKRRMASKLSLEAGETQKQLRSAFRNLDPDSTGFISKEKMEWALGPQYLALDLTPEEAREAVNNIAAEGKKRRGGVKAVDDKESVNYDAFVHYLGLRNVDPNYHPFYDSRSQQLSYMQRKIATLDTSLKDPARLEQLKSLEAGASASKLHMLNKTSSGAQSAPNIGQGPLMAESFPLSKDEMMSTNQHHDDMSHSATSSPSKLLPLSPGPDEGTFGSPISKKRGGAGKETEKMFSKRGTARGSNPATLTRQDSSHVDASLITQMIMRDETLNRRAFHQKGIWEGVSAVDQSLPLYISDRDRFHTTSAEYFPKLTYEPSKAVERDRVGDSSVVFREKEERYKRRAARLHQNMEITENRLKEEKFLEELRKDERDKRKAKDILSYEQTVLVRDMNKFKKREMEVMQRKPHMNQYQKMWGSQMDVRNKNDERDFGTTYMVGFGGSLYNGPVNGDTPKHSSRSIFAQNR